MTDEQLQAIRERYADLIREPTVYRYKTLEERNAILARFDAVALLAYVDFLRALIHDLKEDSTAYRRGLQDGVKQERERCLALAARLEDYHGELPEEARDLLETIRSGMSANACLNCQGRGILFGLETRSPCPVCSGTGSACAEAGQQEGSES